MIYWTQRAKTELEKGVQHIQKFMQFTTHAASKEEITPPELEAIKKAFEQAQKPISDFIQEFDKILTGQLEKK